MLSTLFSDPTSFILSAIGLLAAITIHEFSHALIADHLGDPTPRLQKRLNLNPLSHLDLYGILFMLLVGFGWGKPVVFDPFNLKNPRRDAALISIAGPISNIILAIVLSIIVRIFPVSIFFLFPIIVINVALAVFNLLPVAPLDGFKIVGGILTPKQAKSWYEMERYGFIFLLALLIPFGQSSLLSQIIQPVVGFLLKILLPSSMMNGV